MSGTDFMRFLFTRQQVAPEARGGIRGGHFVADVTGEQYAPPDAVGTLRDLRRREKAGTLVSVSAADPLNLVGIVTPGTRGPALSANRILYRDGASPPPSPPVAKSASWNPSTPRQAGCA